MNTVATTWQLFRR